MKSGPFAEHSNQLYNISGVPAWSKVNSGLIKMYKAEVICVICASLRNFYNVCSFWILFLCLVFTMVGKDVFLRSLMKVSNVMATENL